MPNTRGWTVIQILRYALLCAENEGMIGMAELHEAYIWLEEQEDQESE